MPLPAFGEIAAAEGYCVFSPMDRRFLRTGLLLPLEPVSMESLRS
jgi:hypothetical protein